MTYKRQIVIESPGDASGLVIDYEIRASRAERVWLTVQQDGRVVVTVPRVFPLSVGDKFVKQKISWVRRKLEGIRARAKSLPAIPSGTYRQDRENARLLVLRKLEQFQMMYPFTVKRVTIKNHRSKWGSCSRRGYLNFNYRILYLPEPLADYLIVHELCHLKEMNHSSRFWKLVGQAIPEYRERRKELLAIPLK